MRGKIKAGIIGKIAVLAFCINGVGGSHADRFGSGTNAFTLGFVKIDHIGNPANGSGVGAVDYSYRIGVHEVTTDQFAKAHAASGNRIGNGNENPGSLGKNTAASNVSWMEAARLSNWLTTGNAHTGAYTFDEFGTLVGVNRAAAIRAYGRVYVLPSENEWHKAAYYKRDGSAYTTYSSGNMRPVSGVDANYAGASWVVWDVGSTSIENNGTYDMNGNVMEWTDSAFDGTFDNMAETRVILGGAFSSDERYLNAALRSGLSPLLDSSTAGVRIAVIPETTSLVLFGVVGGLGMVIRRSFWR